MNESGKHHEQYNRERNTKPVDFYIEFTDKENRDKAKIFLKALFSELTRQEPPPLPHGPDGYVDPTEDYIKAQNIIESMPKNDYISNDPNPEKQEIGIKLSFLKTPAHFESPETFRDFILKRLHEQNFSIKQISHHDEVYEVLGGEPMDPKI